MLFGFKAAPLVMGRLSAATGRLVQSLFHPAEGQTQVNIDDVAPMLRGPREYRDLQLAKVIYVLSAFGVHGEGRERTSHGVDRIGAEFELLPHKVILGTPKKMVDEICATLDAWKGKRMIVLKDVRSFLRKLARVARVIPRLRWTVAALYTILTLVVQQEEHLEEERAKKRPHDQRVKVGLVAVKRIGTTLPWLRAVFEAKESMMVRSEPLEEEEPTWGAVQGWVAPMAHCGGI